MVLMPLFTLPTNLFSPYASSRYHLPMTTVPLNTIILLQRLKTFDAHDLHPSHISKSHF